MIGQPFVRIEDFYAPRHPQPVRYVQAVSRVYDKRPYDWRPGAPAVRHEYVGRAYEHPQQNELRIPIELRPFVPSPNSLRGYKGQR